jgi:hypothetical protein
LRVQYFLNSFKSFLFFTLKNVINGKSCRHFLFDYVSASHK